MKNQIIGAVVVAIILFIWQFLSWSMLNIHLDEIAYTEKQDQAIAALDALDLEDGHYYIPRAEPTASTEEANAVLENAIGKPWALLSYHNEMQFSYGSNMLRGFITDLFAAGILVWILTQLATLNMKSAVLVSVGITVFGFATIPYLNSIWLQVPAVGYLIDAVVSGVLAGIWLGWWLGRQNKLPES